MESGTSRNPSSPRISCDESDAHKEPNAGVFQSPTRTNQVLSPSNAGSWLSPSIWEACSFQLGYWPSPNGAPSTIAPPPNTSSAHTPASATTGDLLSMLSPGLTSPSSKPLKLRRKESKKSLQNDFLNADASIYTPVSMASSSKLFASHTPIDTPLGRGTLSFLKAEDFQADDHILTSTDLCATKAFSDELHINESSQFSIKSSSQPMPEMPFFKKGLDDFEWVMNPSAADERSRDAITAAFSSPPAAAMKSNPSVSPSVSDKPTACNCKKSRCLKLYCDCFAHMQYCQGCNCNDCCNKPEMKEVRDEAIRSTKERNPTAFKAKIYRTGAETFHNNGCNCKKSACLKKYCECFEAGVTCAANCKCHDCQNFDGSKELADRRAGKPPGRGKSRAKGSPFGIDEFSSPPGSQYTDDASYRSSSEKPYHKKSARSTRRSSRVSGRKKRATASITFPTYPFYGQDLPPIPKLAALNVYTYLDGPSLYSASLVCKLWHNLAHDDDLWE